MSAFVEGTKKLNYILNRLGLVPSYEVVDRIRKRLCDEVSRHRKGTLRNLPSHNAAVFAVKVLDHKNHHDEMMKVKTVYGLHFTEIEAVLVHVNNIIAQKVAQPNQSERLHERIFDDVAFVNLFIPGERDLDMETHVGTFIAVLYCHKDRFETDDVNRAMSVTHILLSLFEGYSNENGTRYVHVIKENVPSSSAIRKSIKRIYELYQKQREEDWCLSLPVCDQPTFKSFFWTYYEGMER